MYEGKTPENSELVTVTWEDILTEDNWGIEEATVQPVECITVGWLLQDTPSMIVVGSSFDYRAGTFGTIHAFPKVEPKITVIKKGKK